MKKILQHLVLASTCFSLPVSAGWNPFEAKTETTVTSGSDSPGIQEAQSEAYNGPKARIAVSRFTNKAHGSSWYNHQIGDGMADQLTTALVNTNRYIVLERQQLSDVMAEQDLGATGRVRGDTAAPIGQIEGAELLITGAVTEFEGSAEGTSGGGAAGGGLLGNVVGAVSGAVKKAHMAIDIRVIDTKTSRVLLATSVEGSASNVNVGGIVSGLLGTGGSSTALAGGLQSWKNTPNEKALRQCIDAAVDFIVTKTPPVYYRH
jgi:curli biogenesis system outer membrane secretion channel CsgG